MGFSGHVSSFWIENKDQYKINIGPLKVDFGPLYIILGLLINSG